MILSLLIRFRFESHHRHTRIHLEDCLARNKACTNKHPKVNIPRRVFREVLPPYASRVR